MERLARLRVFHHLPRLAAMTAVVAFALMTLLVGTAGAENYKY